MRIGNWNWNRGIRFESRNSKFRRPTCDAFECVQSSQRRAGFLAVNETESSGQTHMGWPTNNREKEREQRVRESNCLQSSTRAGEWRRTITTWRRVQASLKLLLRVCAPSTHSLSIPLSVSLYSCVFLFFLMCSFILFLTAPPNMNSCFLFSFLRPVAHDSVDSLKLAKRVGETERGREKERESARYINSARLCKVWEIS